MKRTLHLLVLFFLIFFILTGCSGKNKNNGLNKEQINVEKATVTPGVNEETKMLLDQLKSDGDYVNSREYPSLIRASIVDEELSDGKNLIIDLRPVNEFTAGHIKGAVNKRFEDLPDYMETGIKPFEYEKIILVDDDGQMASYTACLLRLKGYGNVFAMRWGMSSWNEPLADDGWLKGISSKYESALDTFTVSKPRVGNMPLLSTGLSTGTEISDARFAKLFAEGTGKVFLNADEVFGNPERFFIINLERKDKYDDGHIPGAVRYKPKNTLSFVDEMATIPADKPVVVYCSTGHNSAFATAYLRLLGYDARTLKFGNNGFMFDKMVKEKSTLSWLPFSKTDINNFPVVK